MKKKIGIILAIALLLGVALLVKKRQADLAKDLPVEALPVVAEAIALQPGQITLTIPAIAVVASDLSATLSTRVSGQVLAVYKKEGDRVRKGEKLLSIDASDLVARNAALRAKQEGVTADLAVQRENHLRTMELFAIKGASLEQTRVEEAAITRLAKEEESLRASIREIEALTAYSTLTAPADGTVGALEVRPGDLAVPGKPLVHVAADKGLYLSLSLPDSVMPQGLLVDGKFVKAVPRNQTTATGLIQYLAPLPEPGGLVDGQYCNVRVVLFAGEGLLVPMEALLSVDGESFVLALEGDHARRVLVTVRQRGSEGVVIAESLAGLKVLAARPDILLRAAAGVPVRTMAPAGAKKTPGGASND